MLKVNQNKIYFFVFNATNGGYKSSYKRRVKNKMKNTIAIILGIFLIGMTTAIYAGDTYEHDFNYPIINCSILDNSLNLEGLNLTWNDSIAKIDTQLGYYPDNFTLSCWINESREIVSGGNSGSKKITLVNDSVDFVVEEWNYIAPKEETKEIIKEEPFVPIKEKKGLSQGMKIAIGVGCIVIGLSIVFLIRRK